MILRAGGNLQRPASTMDVYGGGYDATRILEQTQQGISGYDPEELDMRGVFMARGPGTETEMSLREKRLSDSKRNFPKCRDDRC